MRSEFIKDSSSFFYRSGVTTLGFWYRGMTIFASSDDGQGLEGTDFRFTIAESSDASLYVYEQRCGRTKGSYWSDPEDSFRLVTDKGFFETAQEIIRRFGKERVSSSRIGEVERW